MTTDQRAIYNIVFDDFDNAQYESDYKFDMNQLEEMKDTNFRSMSSEDQLNWLKEK